MDYSKHQGNTYALRIKNLNGQVKDYPVDSKTYWSFHDKFVKLYSKTVIFSTTEEKRIRGILENVVCTLNLEKQ